MAGFPGGMPAMTGMNGGNGAMMDEEAMKQQMIIKYVRYTSSSQTLPNPYRTLTQSPHRCNNPWNPAPANSPCPA
jgi:hypothetical protein